MSTLNRREMIQRSAACGAGAVIGEAGFAEQAFGDDASSAQRASGATPIQTRMFWTWDHSTEWALNRPGAHTHGSCNEYGRSTDSFVQDYTALLRWCGLHDIDAVVVWGLLRAVFLAEYRHHRHAARGVGTRPGLQANRGQG